MASKTYVPIETDEFSLVLGADIEGDFSFYAEINTVYVIVSETEIIDFNAVDPDDIYKLGGINFAYNRPSGYYVYAKGATENSRLFYLPKGQLDPTKDVTTIYELLQSLTTALSEHVDRRDDPHDVTAAQVGLENLPNAITSDPNVDDPDILPTSVITAALRTTLNDFMARVDNPHNVTQMQVGLGNVPNYPTTTILTAIMDRTREDILATIANIHTIVDAREEETCTIPPNTVIDAPLETQVDQDVGVCDPTSKTLILSDNTITLPVGVQLCYCKNGRTYITRDVETAPVLSKNDISPDVDPIAGTYYIYAEIDENGYIAGLNSTLYRPVFGIVNVDNDHDLFHVAKYQMYDGTGEEVSRVYVGRVVIDDSNNITSMVATPVGNSIIIKPAATLSPGSRVIVNNPFFEDVIPSVEVLINGVWADPKWNDQIGVIANYSRDNPDNIIVQAGQLGIAMPAVSAGNAYSSTDLSSTYTDAVPFRVILRKGAR